MKKIHIRLTALTERDTAHQEFMDNLKKDIEDALDKMLLRPCVTEIILGKEQKKKEGSKRD